MGTSSGKWKNMNGEVLTLRGRFAGFDSTGAPKYGLLTLRDMGTPLPPPTPYAATLTLTQPTQTSAVLTWVPGRTTGIPPVKTWLVNRRYSLDNGVTWTAWAAIGGTITGSTHTMTDSPLPTPSGSTQIMFQYKVRGDNVSGIGLWSNITTVQWQVAILQQPAKRTGFSVTAKTTTNTTVAWTNPSTDTGVTKIAVIDTDTKAYLANNLSSTASTTVLANLTPGATYDNIAVIAYNGWNGSNSLGLAGWSEASGLLTFVQPTDNIPTSAMMMGVSTQQDGGGITNWDGYRVYSQSRLMDFVPPNRKTNLPKFLAYSKDGPNLGGANPNYTAVYNEVIADLESFYYTTAGGHSGAWGIQLYWSNGNENYDKGALATTPHSAAAIAAFKVSQKALYDACHKLNADGSRRYPDAYAGSNPTQNAEQTGLVADWLHPTAEFHDFVMWSHYPPGRMSTQDDPIFNWDSMKDTDATNRNLGFLTRTYTRTKAAEADAQTRVPGHKLLICTGEVGIGANPNDSTTRPYYAVHGIAGTMAKLATAHNLNHVFACWWDNDLATATDPGTGHDILSDEPSTTSPSTAEAWQHWTKYNHQFGGTHPASWAGNPKSTWKTTGPVS